ncbi:HNH endonuclease signature motif containing protein [Xenorhabdus stockiae]|uniref:HNH endonuclease signature motif containing protein n=1 Tax=Xenorhabdus TaxID=626 RepID=UPI000C0422A9|nr:HNH endonuclease [Xenorhabdus sp. KJ12.1]PHM66709.1 HNH endonuclease:NUMOD4 [Xenorhabdus sp. KJ12.1]
MTESTLDSGDLHVLIKEIKGFPGYFASKEGEIFSLRTNQLKRLKTRIRHGYKRVNVRSGTGRKTVVTKPVHQLVLLAHKGDKPKECDLTRHLNGNPLDNRLENLRWGTHKENVLDSIRHGTAVCLSYGEKAVATKLSDDDVLKIEQRVLNGKSKLSVAREFGISASHVRSIVNHRTRRYLWAGGG